jgi:quercetin dioxygenase-like cupin family protein
MKFIKTNEKEWQDKQGYSKRIFLNEKDLNSSGALVQEIKIKAHDEAGAHYHKKQTEVFYFLNNNGYFTVNGEKINPEVGDIIVVEPNDIHAVTNNTDEDFLYIAFKTNYEESDFYWE